MHRPAGNTGDLSDFLDARTAPGELCEPMGRSRVRCLACGHRCVIPPGHRGVCKVRFNEDGALRVPWGYVAGLQCDPIEKKPFYHLLPGARTMTFGMLGCDLHCPGCQNWVTSQALRDPAAGAMPEEIPAERIVRLALHHGARLVASSYNEPLITAEWGVAVFKEARRAGLRTCVVSNGNATREALTYLNPWCDGYKIDLKTMSPSRFRELGGVLDHVLESVEMACEMGFWVEIVTLVIPGWNDSDEELGDVARFIASISKDIPWHVTAFHADYRMTDFRNTPEETLLRAAGAGETAGLRFVYAGNLPGRVGQYQNTYCPRCRALLVERRGFYVAANRLAEIGGRCPSCHQTVPGIWEQSSWRGVP